MVISLRTGQSDFVEEKSRCFNMSNGSRRTSAATPSFNLRLDASKDTERNPQILKSFEMGSAGSFNASGFSTKTKFVCFFCGPFSDFSHMSRHLDRDHL